MPKIKLLNKSIQEGVINSMLISEKNATLETFRNLKILRYINRFDKPCFRVYVGNSIKPLAASFFLDEESRETRVKIIKDNHLKSLCYTIPAFSNTFGKNYTFYLNDYSNLLN